MSRKCKAFISLVLATLIVFGLLPVPPIEQAQAAIDDSGDLNLSNNQAVTMSPAPSDGLPPNPIKRGGNVVYSGKWQVYVNGKKDKNMMGYDKAVKQLITSGPNKGKADQYNFVQFSKISQWVDVFDGDSSFVNANASKFKVTISGSQRIYLGYLADLCGGYVGNYVVTGEEGSTGNVYADPSDRPTANIGVNKSVQEGKPVTINLSGQAFSVLDSDVSNALKIPAKQVIATFNIDGQTVFSGKTINNTNSYKETITRTFTAGSHTLTLFIKDNVNRYTRTDVTINVESTDPPPEKPGNINADLKMTLNPSSMKAGSKGTVKISLDATGCTSSGSGPFDYRWFVKLNGSYINPGGSQGVNPGDHSPYYSLSASNAKAGDVIWAQVKAYDWSINKSSQAETQDTIREEGEEPEEDEPEPDPVPPEPENIPPVAKFKMPSKTGQGTTVDVVNKSYDLDGEIVDVEWDVSPSAGDDLGFDGGTITFDETGTYDVTLTVEDDRGDTDSTSKSIEVTNDPPVAVISAPDEVTQGDNVDIKSKSYDPDGNIAATHWGVSPVIGVNGTLTGDSSTVWFDNVGQYTVSLTVEDEFGLTDTAEKTITVKPVIPVAYFDYIGTLKENRKIILDASQSTTSERYPMVWGETQWEITPPSGVSADNIKIVSSSDMQKRTVLFKKAGDYTVRVRVKNAAGNYSEWYERTLTIYPDQPPIADFYVQSTVLRDPDNGNKATIELLDSSYSPDGDTISQRIWKYKYDSDNDGSFADESWTTLDSGNNVNPVLYSSQVGRYLFELTVKESYGEETIPEFITASDTRTDDTTDKDEESKTTEVINLQPTVDFEMYAKKKAELVIRVGKLNDYDTRIVTLENAINSLLIPLLKSKNIDVKIVDSDFGQGQIGGETSYNGSVYTVLSYIIKATVNTKGQFGVTTVDGFPEYSSDNNRYLLYKGDVSRTSALVVRINGAVYNLYASSPKSISVSGGKIIVTYDAIDGVNVTVTYTIYDDKYVMIEMEGKNTTSGNKNIGFKVFYDTDVAGNDGVPIRIVDKGFEIYNDSVKVRAVGVLKNHPAITPPSDWKIEDWSSSLYKYWPYDDGGAHYSNKYKIGDTYHKDDTAISIWWDSQSINPGGTRSITTFLGIDRPVEAKLDPIGKSMANVIWNDDNAGRYMLLFNDISFLDYTDSTVTTNFANAINQEAVKLVLSGQTSLPQDQAQGIINLSAYGGTAIRNDAMESQIQAIADYIAKDMENKGQLIEKYVLVNEEVEYKTYYSDPESDSKYQERWLYTHDPTYFENSMGLASFSGQYIPGPVTAFDKIGEYDVVFQARDNPKDDNRFDNYRLWSYMPLNKLTIYVHRKPIAQFAVSMTPNSSNYNISVTDQSYDLDHVSRSDKGIQAWEWKWKDVSETTWHSGRLNGVFPVGKSYLLYLRVQDIEGAWSDPKVQVITTQNMNLPPVAQFTVNPSTQVINKAITITDQSYDPNGDPIAEWKWRVQKQNGTWVDYGGTKPTNIPSLGVGTYTIELTVRDDPQYGTTLWSEPYTQQVTVIPENNKPVARFTIGPNPIIADEAYTLNDTSYDPDGDPIVAREWKIQKPDGSWVTINDWKSTFEEMGFDDGIYKIQLRVLDDPMKRHPALTPMWSNPYTVTVQVEGKLTVIGDSDRDTYAAGQALLLDAETEGKAFKVEATCWWNHNEYTNTNTTTLVPDRTITDPPQDVMTWHSRRERGDRDIIVIIPMKTADGTYPVKFTAYKRKADGSTKTAEDTIYIKVKGTIYDYSHSEIIGK